MDIMRGHLTLQKQWMKWSDTHDHLDECIESGLPDEEDIVEARMAMMPMYSQGNSKGTGKDKGSKSDKRQETPPDGQGERNNQSRDKQEQRPDHKPGKLTGEHNRHNANIQLGKPRKGEVNMKGKRNIQKGQRHQCGMSKAQVPRCCKRELCKRRQLQIIS